MPFMYMQQQTLGTIDFCTGYDKELFSSEKSKWCLFGWLRGNTRSWY